ncbi:NAD-dependent dihydropyrimidine dehydrogenase subunit PreA [Leptolyngbya sp. FACHB-261]|uniref:NAD-dependent dihydropyrimidine dehydrogenase subunit PreA n=1 Tax=Leptolyngbya sp. FACHB-261 TaxID=2692806 RepID=UPI0016827C63|nr:NAD-dependent dihydropyrimidine dehydrogenase subunit PreA [Leptolyngbya sp. FACHB-261]MBD2099298.1 NAD-dependent dihydropyrimidine dehydrogenase subunit PreA [Leptolyngbya sp. FACHB-261]
MTDKNLSITVNGLEFDNPFVIASGPPGTNGHVIAKAFDAGWGGVIAKTIALESDKVVNVIPRYGKLRAAESGEIIGFENIELISDRSFEVWLEEFRDLKRQYPNKILIASIMEEYRKEAWQEIVTRVQATGVDALELNLSCPHGMPERKMGAAVGQDCSITEEVCSWVKEVATIPTWAKMTPNITDITQPARVAIDQGIDGISAINTILSIISINLKTLRPEPCVKGWTVPGGYSSQAVRPIALRMVMELARSLPNIPISAIGGIHQGADAIQFMLLGASTVQVCTGVMLKNYDMVAELQETLAAFMSEHQFESVRDFIGLSLPYFSTHADLVDRMLSSRSRTTAQSRDDDWAAQPITSLTHELTTTESEQPTAVAPL